MTKKIISIGLPVYNGSNYIAESIASIINQDEKNFELIICDNASFDDTEEICHEFIKKDSRIKYFRNSRNYGAAYNYNKSFFLSSGKYFKWASHDDIMHPKFLKNCLERMENDKGIALCYSKTYKIDKIGRIIGDYCTTMKWNSNSTIIRFRDAIINDHPCVAIFGLIRRDILKGTNLIGPYFGSDRNLLADIALKGQIFEIPDYLFYRRDHSESSVKKYSIRDRLNWFDSSKTNKIAFPSWRIFIEYFSSIKLASITLPQRLRCLQYLAVWVVKNWRWLGSDIKYAMQQLLK